MKTEKAQYLAASKAGMDEKTARKYIRSNKLPSQLKKEHTWRTRKDPFEAVWSEVSDHLQTNSGLDGVTIFFYLQRKYPGKFADGQLRTLQRKIKIWRALEGPGKEIFFPQEHKPGRLAESDFTDMSKLSITVGGQHFKHLLYHFVLTYSNWEHGTICFSESYESLSEGLQNALWELGGIPAEHKTDRLSAAVHKVSHPEEFTRAYSRLLKHYGLRGRKIQAGKANENGDIEQRHFRFKRALDQALMLRGSRDFSNRDEYRSFLDQLFNQLNAGRQSRLTEEMKVVKPLPVRRLNDCKRQRVKVGPSSTIHVQHNIYSVPSRLVKEWVDVKIYAEYLEIWYAQKQIETIPRLKGEYKHAIEYRHVIDWLVRKPGAFENYRYHADLFPTSRFRMAYDYLKKNNSARADKEYLKILYLASKETEAGVDDALRFLFDQEKDISSSLVEEIVVSAQAIPAVTEVVIEKINLSAYDELLSEREVCYG
ncbi:MAG: IS21 family transposase [Candidatus Scalindua sp.]|nr:IS21 family transposase [Candidatus Scalindua sp.]